MPTAIAHRAHPSLFAPPVPPCPPHALCVRCALPTNDNVHRSDNEFTDVEKFRESLELNSGITAVLGPYQGGAHNVHYTAHVKAVVGGGKTNQNQNQNHAAGLIETGPPQVAHAEALRDAAHGAEDEGAADVGDMPVETDVVAVVAPMVPLEVNEHEVDEHDHADNGADGDGAWY